MRKVMGEGWEVICLHNFFPTPSGWQNFFLKINWDSFWHLPQAGVVLKSICLALLGFRLLQMLYI